MSGTGLASCSVEAVGDGLYSGEQELPMRIQTRLFLGTAALVLALMGLQWWLYARQLRAIEADLTRVATTVGEGLLTAEGFFLGHDVVIATGEEPRGTWVDHTIDVQIADVDDSEERTEQRADVLFMPVPARPPADVAADSEQPAPAADEPPSPGTQVYEWVVEHQKAEGDRERVIERHLRQIGPDGEVETKVRRLKVKVEPGEQMRDRVLVVSEDDRKLHKIPIPTSPTVQRVQSTMREGAAVGGVLLAVGLFASAVLSRRLVRPLRALADGVETIGRGELGVQVPESATGEVGDLQRSFNRMSERLAELEAERESWRKREHLAQLGDLSRGLAHTLRNPLHTLGLAVEELAEGSGDRQRLVATSRGQIRRIDRWLRSFLALGAEESAEPESTDLHEIAAAVALESVQQGARVRVERSNEELEVRAVPGAVRAALANLVENAVDVSPPGEEVRVELARERGGAVIRVIDCGPGLPDEVRQRLYSPHVTTKVGGSGMGLFLARQLIVGMHGGELEIADGEHGGTVAEIRLPLAAGEASADEVIDG
jgi:signal transduction histidine kinase